VAKKASNVQELIIEGKTLKLSNLDKMFFPAAGFTKGQLIDYYIRIASCLLPHLKNRPVTLIRYPDGVGGKFFYEKDAPKYTPEWVKTFPVPRRKGGTDIRYILVNDLATLVWCANIGTIEFHSFLHRVPAIERPTAVVFDLDPGEGTNILDCIKVGFSLKEVLRALKLTACPKVSGSKGIQIYVPLNGPYTYEKTRFFARTMAESLERQHPQLVVLEMAKSARSKKVFVDWSQNSDFKTTVSVYSMRAKRDHPFVSAPVTWEELKEALERNDPASLDFAPAAAIERCEKLGDLFAPVLTMKHKLA
jgi:bifunctional non-homologous end joining protein LigD